MLWTLESIERWRQDGVLAIEEQVFPLEILRAAEELVHDLNAFLFHYWNGNYPSAADRSSRAEGEGSACMAVVTSPPKGTSVVTNNHQTENWKRTALLSFHAHGIHITNPIPRPSAWPRSRVRSAAWLTMPSPDSAESEDTMTGPEHFRTAEQLLGHAASMLDADVAPEDRAELVQRQAAVASMATGHALLAAAAAIGRALIRIRPTRGPGETWPLRASLAPSSSGAASTFTGSYRGVGCPEAGQMARPPAESAARDLSACAPGRAQPASARMPLG